MTQEVIWEGSRGKEGGRQDKYEIGMKQEELNESLNCKDQEI